MIHQTTQRLLWTFFFDLSHVSSFKGGDFDSLNLYWIDTPEPWLRKKTKYKKGKLTIKNYKTESTTGSHPVHCRHIAGIHPLSWTSTWPSFFFFFFGLSGAGHSCAVNIWPGDNVNFISLFSPAEKTNLLCLIQALVTFYLLRCVCNSFTRKKKNLTQQLLFVSLQCLRWA